MKYGNGNEIPPCKVRCPADIFENAIRAIGAEAACEWFGHSCDSDFTKSTIKILRERSSIEPTTKVIDIC